jgi:hypothetical protein
MIETVLRYCDLEQLEKDVRLSYQAALEVELYKSDYFNFFLADLLRMNYRDYLYNKHKISNKIDDIIYEEPITIDYHWVLDSNTLNLLKRQIFYEYYILGNSSRKIAEKFNITSRTVTLHLTTVKQEEPSSLLEDLKEH